CFQNCKKLTSVVLPSGIGSLPASVFSNCSSLQSVSIPESVTTIGSSAFANCSSLDSIKLPSSLNALSIGMLQNCSSLKEVVVPAGITALQNQIFSGCSSLEKVTLSPEIAAISQSAFANCPNLHTIAYHGDTEENVPGVIKLGGKTLSIGQYAFQNCKSIKEIILPDGFTTIGGREPFKKTGISQLVIPASVTSMNQNYICGDNDSVTFYMCSTTPVTVNKFTFAKASGNYSFPVIVPTGSSEIYKAATNWNFYSVSQPVVKTLSLSEMKLSDGTLSGRVGVNYDIELPERFASVNDSIVLESHTISVSLISEGVDTVVAEVKPAADGRFSSVVEGFKGRSGVTALARASDDENSYVSEAAEVEVSFSVPFSFAEAEYNAHFDEQFTPGIVFEDDTYSIADLNFSTTDSDIVYVNKRTGAVSVKRVEGDAVIRAYVTEDPEIYAEMTVHAALANPVEGFILGDGSKNITISYMDIYALCPAVQPSNADIQSYNIEIS
ncbi:MAG: leucine-rich repeat domain-containing protein, partial [Muribaculaceae bacterium]|nr:leucine-rich repeat domain-containing protein [Muribaculaceae bacterium]